MKSYLTDNEVVLKNYEDVVTFQKLLIENGYVVMVSREEWFWIVNWIWDPENAADRNAVIFISREDYEYEEEQRQKEEKKQKEKEEEDDGNS